MTIEPKTKPEDRPVRAATGLKVLAILVLALPCLLPSAAASTPVDRAQEVASTWRHDVCTPTESPSGSSHGLQATIRGAHIDSVWFAVINGSGPEYSWLDHAEVNGVAVTSDPFSYNAPPPTEPTVWDSNPNYSESASKGMSQRVTLYVKGFFFSESGTTDFDATLELCAGTPWNEYVLYGHEDPHVGP